MTIYLILINILAILGVIYLLHHPRSKQIKKRYHPCTVGDRIYGYQSLLRILENRKSHLKFLTSMGLTFTAFIILQSTGPELGLNVLKRSRTILQSSTGNYVSVYKYLPKLDTFTYLYHPTLEDLNSDEVSLKFEKSIFCTSKNASCNIFKQDVVIHDSAVCNFFLSGYLWTDPISKRDIHKKTISTMCGDLRVGSGFTYSELTPVESSNYLQHNKNGIIGIDAGIRQSNIDTPPPKQSIDWKPKMTYSDEDMFKNFDIDYIKLLKIIDISGDNAFEALGHIFVAYHTIKELGIHRAIDVLKSQESIDTLKTLAGNYLFISEWNKLTNTFTSRVHTFYNYTNETLRETEDKLLRSIICDNQDEACVIVDNELYKTYRHTQDLVGGINVFNKNNHILDFVYPNINIGKLTNKRAIYFKFVDPENVYIDYIIGSGWATSLLRN
jgi:hypothetical protein